MKTHVTSLLSDYVDGTLSPFWVEKIKSHLTFCNACRQRLQELQENVRLLQRSPSRTPSKVLESRVIEAVKRELTTVKPDEKVEGPRWYESFFSMRNLSLAAAALLVLIVVRHAPEHLGTKRKEAATIPENSAVPAVQLMNAESRAKEAPLNASVEAQAKQPELEAQDIAPLEAKSGAVVRAELSDREQLETSKASTLQEHLKSKMEPMAAARPSETAAKTGAEGTGEGLAMITDALSKSDLADKKMETKAQFRSFAKDASPEVSRRQAKPASNDLVDLRGFSTGVDEPRRLVISDADAWSNLWAEHMKTSRKKTPAPEIDFKTQQVIAVFAGNTPSAGYGVEIESVETTEWDGKPARVVRYRLTKPGPGAMTAQVVTQPFAMKAVPRFTGKTFFRENR